MLIPNIAKNPDTFGTQKKSMVRNFWKYIGAYVGWVHVLSKADTFGTKIIEESLSFLWHTCSFIPV